MEMRWDLSALYESFECEAFVSDFNLVAKHIGEIKHWAENNLKTHEHAADKIELFLKQQIAFDTLFTKLMVYCNLSNSVDAKNETALKYMGKLQVQVSELTKPSVSFQKWLMKVEDLRSVIQTSDFLKTHQYYLHEAVKQGKYLLSDEQEVLYAKMSNTGGKAWTKLQNKLTSTLMIDLEENGEIKQYPLPVIRNMAYHANSEIRKKAYQAELLAYPKIETAMAACLNGIKGEVITMSQLRNYESPLMQTIEQSRLDKETIEAMFEAMRESFPKFRSYYKAKAKLLGHEKGLPFYDLFAPVSQVEQTFSYDEARAFIVTNFGKFSKALADFADNAFEKHWIDAEPREGKRGGAFCSNIHPIGESRFLANFDGSFGNVKTLAHELGHGYHGHCLKNESLLNSHYTMPIAETASIFCETIVTNAALKGASDEEAFSILEHSISDAGQVIVDIYSRFLFESKLFETRADHELSVEELKEAMLEAQREAYGDGLDQACLHPYMWANKPHYYSSGLSFYNFPYAFGLLFAKGVYAEYLKRGEAFIPEYDKLLAATGKNDIADVAKMVGIDIRQPEFWRASLALVGQDIDQFIALAEAKHS